MTVRTRAIDLRTPWLQRGNGSGQEQLGRSTAPVASSRPSSAALSPLLSTRCFCPVPFPTCHSPSSEQLPLSLWQSCDCGWSLPSELAVRSVVCPLHPGLPLHPPAPFSPPRPVLILRLCTHIRVSLLEAPPATFWTRSWRSSPLSSSSCFVRSDLDFPWSSYALTFACQCGKGTEAGESVHASLTLHVGCALLTILNCVVEMRRDGVEAKRRCAAPGQSNSTFQAAAAAREGKAKISSSGARASPREEDPPATRGTSTRSCTPECVGWLTSTQWHCPRLSRRRLQA